MKPDQWSAPGGMRSPSPLHKEKGSLPGGNGGTQVHPGAAQLGEARAQAGSCLPRLPSRMALLSREKARTEIVPRAKWSLFGKRNHSELCEWQVSRHPLFLPQAAPAPLRWSRRVPLGHHPLPPPPQHGIMLWQTLAEHANANWKS